MTNPETSTSRRRRSPTRARLHVRLEARERDEIDQAVKAGGFLSPVPLLLSLIRQQERVDGLTAAVNTQLQAAVQSAVSLELAALADRLAADLAALSAAIDERPTKTQLQGFISHVQSQAKR